VAAAGGRTGARAWIEVAKLLEHRARDPVAALAAVERADALVARARLRGRIPGGVEADLAKRRRRLRERINRAAARCAPPAQRGALAPRLVSGWR
jgi:hypothetical protein